MKQCTDTLSSLKTKQLDVYYLHAPDEKTAIEDTLETIQKLHEGFHQQHDWFLRIRQACHSLANLCSSFQARVPPFRWVV